MFIIPMVMMVMFESAWIFFDSFDEADNVYNTYGGDGDVRKCLDLIFFYHLID
jgi:hypothetical protein